MCNVIRREIGIPDKKSYVGCAVNASQAVNVEMKFGFLNGSEELYKSDIDNRNTNYPSPPKKYPKNQGIGIIDENNYLKLVQMNYVIKLKYNGRDEIYNFS